MVCDVPALQPVFEQTPVGTVIGAGVAIFSDGAIDSLFENGPDVGKAFSEGVDLPADTGKAIGGDR